MSDHIVMCAACFQSAHTYEPDETGCQCDCHTRRQAGGGTMSEWVLSKVYYEPDDDEQAERVLRRLRGVLDDEGITSYTIITEPEWQPS